jgi:hypothetical protein
VWLTVNGVTHSLPSGAVAIAMDDDLVVGWNPVSDVIGIGREAMGLEAAGIGATLPPDIRHTVVEVLDSETEAVIAQSDPLPAPISDWAYWREMNIFDHGSYETDLIFRVVQFDQAGRRRELGTVETT